MAGPTLLVFTILLFFYLSGASSDLITKCKLEDSKCLKDSAQAIIPKFAKGLPEYNVKTLDPMMFKKIDASTPNLKLNLFHLTLTGLKDCIAKKIKHDKVKTKMFVKLLCSCQLDGQYEMDGKLLIIPIQGKGAIHIKLRKIEISIDADMNEIETGGVSYWNIRKWEDSFSLKDKSDIVFENLFNGNEVLAQAARDVISSSGNDIILEIGQPIIKKAILEVTNNINNFIHNIPASEISLD